MHHQFNRIMEEFKIAGAALPAMPWEERPAGCKDVVWRCSANPIIPRDLLPTFKQYIQQCRSPV